MNFASELKRMQWENRNLQPKMKIFSTYIHDTSNTVSYKP